MVLGYIFRETRAKLKTAGAVIAALLSLTSTVGQSIAQSNESNRLMPNHTGLTDRLLLMYLSTKESVVASRNRANLSALARPEALSFKYHELIAGTLLAGLPLSQSRVSVNFIPRIVRSNDLSHHNILVVNPEALVAMPSHMKCNCNFLAGTNAVVCDEKFFDAFLSLAGFSGPLSQSENTGLANVSRIFLVRWLIGHELGHIHLEHGSAPSMARMLRQTNNGIAIVEAEADAFFATTFSLAQVWDLTIINHHLLFMTNQLYKTYENAQYGRIENYLAYDKKVRVPAVAGGHPPLILRIIELRRALLERFALNWMRDPSMLENRVMTGIKNNIALEYGKGGLQTICDLAEHRARAARANDPSSLSLPVISTADLQSDAAAVMVGEIEVLLALGEFSRAREYIDLLRSRLSKGKSSFPDNQFAHLLSLLTLDLDVRQGKLPVADALRQLEVVERAMPEDEEISGLRLYARTLTVRFRMMSKSVEGRGDDDLEQHIAYVRRAISRHRARKDSPIISLLPIWSWIIEAIPDPGLVDQRFWLMQAIGNIANIDAGLDGGMPNVLDFVRRFSAQRHYLILKTFLVKEMRRQLSHKNELTRESIWRLNYLIRRLGDAETEQDGDVVAARLAVSTFGDDLKLDFIIKDVEYLDSMPRSNQTLNLFWFWLDALYEEFVNLELVGRGTGLSAETTRFIGMFHNKVAFWLLKRSRPQEAIAPLTKAALVLAKLDVRNGCGSEVSILRDHIDHNFGEAFLGIGEFRKAVDHARAALTCRQARKEYGNIAWTALIHNFALNRMRNDHLTSEDAEMVVFLLMGALGATTSEEVRVPLVVKGETVDAAAEIKSRMKEGQLVRNYTEVDVDTWLQGLLARKP